MAIIPTVRVTCTHDHNISLQAGAVDGVLLHHHTVALHLIAHLALAIEVADDGEE